DGAGTLLIAGGRVVDPSRGTDGALGVLVEDGKVRAVAPNLLREGRYDRVIDGRAGRTGRSYAVHSRVSQEFRRCRSARSFRPTSSIASSSTVRPICAAVPAKRSVMC
ncbi:MAG: hypothetical protein ACLGIW_14650, partial [Gammaproteobacteria bacterium]